MYGYVVVGWWMSVGVDVDVCRCVPVVYVDGRLVDVPVLMYRYVVVGW
jgi:hypothetical protein